MRWCSERNKMNHININAIGAHASHAAHSCSHAHIHTRMRIQITHASAFAHALTHTTKMIKWNFNRLTVGREGFAGASSANEHTMAQRPNTNQVFISYRIGIAQPWDMCELRNNLPQSLTHMPTMVAMSKIETIFLFPPNHEILFVRLSSLLHMTSSEMPHPRHLFASVCVCAALHLAADRFHPRVDYRTHCGG